MLREPKTTKAILFYFIEVGTRSKTTLPAGIVSVWYWHDIGIVWYQESLLRLCPDLYYYIGGETR